MKKKEYQINDTFNLHDYDLKCVKYTNSTRPCTGCVFAQIPFDIGCNQLLCAIDEREDELDVIFILDK